MTGAADIGPPQPAVHDAEASPSGATASGTDWLAIGAAAVTVVLWASAFVGIRAASETLEAPTIALARLLIGSAVLGTAVAVRRSRLPSRTALRPLLVCGTLWFGLYNLALNQGERLIDPGTAAMLVNVAPIVIAAVAGRVLGEGFPKPLFVGGAVAFAGVAVIAASTTTSPNVSLAGVALCLLAALAYASGAVAQKVGLHGQSPLPVTWVCCLVGAVVCAPFAPWAAADLAEADRASVIWVVYLGVFPTAVAFTTWAYALSRMTAGQPGATTYLVPPVAVLFAWAALDEVPRPLALAGGALCLAGVALTRRRSSTNTRRRPPG